MRRHWSQGLRERVKSLFPDPDFDELFDFNLLHKAVLGLENCSIETAMATDSSQINKQDSEGYTPLTWAVCRGDLGAAKQLLSYRPDCNMPDQWGLTPLAYAADNSAECVELLLQANADIHTRSSQGHTALHRAAQNFSQNDQAFRIVKACVRAGVDVNAVTLLNETALHLTSSLEVAEYLIRIGTDLGVLDNIGHNALSKNVSKNNHALIRLFLQEQLDHTPRLEYYSTLVHLAAEFADTETLTLLAHGGLQRRPINVPNKAGLTPIELANQRRNVDSEWRIAFFNFLDSIDDNPLLADTVSLRSSRGTRIWDEDANERLDDEFEDAVEFQAAAEHS